MLGEIDQANIRLAGGSVVTGFSERDVASYGLQTSPP
jgi:hypothetical protein